MKDLLILGASENGVLALDVISRINKLKLSYKVLGFLDDSTQKQGSLLCGLPVLGPLSYWEKYSNCFFTTPFVTAPKTNHCKKLVIERERIPYDRFINIVDPQVSLPDCFELGVGNLICAGAQIQPDVKLASHVYISNNSVICSRTIVGDFCNISNSASIMGQVDVGTGAYIGSNSSIIGKKKIGRWSIVGMGSVVLSDISDFSIVAGNPARKIGVNIDAQAFFSKI